MPRVPKKEEEEEDFEAETVMKRRPPLLSILYCRALLPGAKKVFPRPLLPLLSPFTYIRRHGYMCR